MCCRGIPKRVYNFSFRDAEVDDDDDGHLHRCGYHNQNVKDGNVDGDCDRVHHRCGHSNQDVESGGNDDLPRHCGHCVWIVAEHSDGDVPHRCGRLDISVDENAGYHGLGGDDECPKSDGHERSYFDNSEHSSRQSDHTG